MAAHVSDLCVHVDRLAASMNFSGTCLAKNDAAALDFAINRIDRKIAYYCRRETEWQYRDIEVYAKRII